MIKSCGGRRIAQGSSAHIALRVHLLHLLSAERALLSGDSSTGTDTKAVFVDVPSSCLTLLFIIRHRHTWTFYCATNASLFSFFIQGASFHKTPVFTPPLLTLLMTEQMSRDAYVNPMATMMDSQSFVISKGHGLFSFSLYLD